MGRALHGDILKSVQRIRAALGFVHPITWNPYSRYSIHNIEIGFFILRTTKAIPGCFSNVQQGFPTNSKLICVSLDVTQANLLLARGPMPTSTIYSSDLYVLQQNVWTLIIKVSDLSGPKENQNCQIRPSFHWHRTVSLFSFTGLANSVEVTNNIDRI